MSKCLECGIDVSDKAKYCSPRCKQVAFRKRSVTQNGNVTTVTAEKEPTVTFRFYTKINAHPQANPPEEETKSAIREAKYWYDVPLGAIPVRQKDWPEMPDYMNGREYFLWWKNEFKTNDKNEPVILNPYPVYEKVEYINAGEGSRRWGL